MEPTVNQNKVWKGVILLADDKKEFRDIYGDRLRFAGYDVLEAEDGAQALKILGEKKPDLIISDINMPKMDGYDLITAIKINDTIKNTPIIVMSVFDQSEHFKKAMELGAADYLVKGVTTPNAFVEKVNAILHKT